LLKCYPDAQIFGIRIGHHAVHRFGFCSPAVSGGKPMNVKKPASRHSLKSDLAHIDAHSIKPEEYEELPELTDEMLARAKVNKGGRPVSQNPRKLISLSLVVTAFLEGCTPEEIGEQYPSLQRLDIYLVIGYYSTSIQMTYLGVVPKCAANG
jgi:uncharacterized protein (DUF433 family)